MKKSQFYLSFPFVLIVLILFMPLLQSCESFFENEYFDYSEIDALSSIDESGRLKWQYTYGSSEDESINSGIEFIYDENKNLIEKQYRHFYDNKPTSYDIMEFFFYNENGRLSKMERYTASGTDDTSILLKRYSLYSYPETGIKIETKFDCNDIQTDSIIFEYEGDLLVSEMHYDPDGNWWKNYEYNNKCKPESIFDSFTNRTHKYFYDENDLLLRIEEWSESKIASILYYEREQKNNVLTIRSYRGQENEPEKNYLGKSKYIDGKLFEYINYHPGFPGSEWWCIRYQYYEL